MSSSILDDVKHLLGLMADDTSFDTDVVLHINSAFGTLHQLGVGPVEGFMITDNTAKWDDFFDLVTLNAVKSYVYLKVRLIFDPPKTGFEMTAINDQIRELEFRLNVVADYG